MSMTIFRNFLVAGAMIGNGIQCQGALDQPPVTNAPPCIKLCDQFGGGRRLAFPAPRPTLVTIADRQGASQISAWVKPVAERFGRRIAICGIADLSSVPVALRSWVKERFRKTQPYPVMMDWTGQAAQAFAFEAGKANILVLSRHGKVLYRASGPVSGQEMSRLYGVLAAALAASTNKSAIK